MPTFGYTQGRPAGNLTPAAQRSQMQINNDSNFSIWAEDHYGFNDPEGGAHKKVNYPLNVTPADPAGFALVTYTKPGVADTNSSQLYYKNGYAVAPDPPTQNIVSGVKAWGYINGGGAIINGQNNNIASIAHAVNSGSYTITLVPNTLVPNGAASADYGVFVQAQDAARIFATGYSIIDQTQFTVSFFRLPNNAFADPNAFCVTVFQI